MSSLKSERIANFSLDSVNGIKYENFRVEDSLRHYSREEDLANNEFGKKKHSASYSERRYTVVNFSDVNQHKSCEAEVTILIKCGGIVVKEVI